MEEPNSLIKANPLTEAEDYTWLRKHGLEYIEQAGSALWTDYNNSDPGITILEAVCYAITDLAYRTGFEVKDLLAPKNINSETWKQVFYTARQILHNTPLTLNDYRKLLIDVKGVRNAWIDTSKDYEVPVWVDYNFSRLDPHHDCSCETHPIDECKGKLTLEAATKETVLADKDRLRQEIEEAMQKISEEKYELEMEGDQVSEKYQEIVKRVEDLKELHDRIKYEYEQIQTDARQIVASKIVEFEGLYNVMIEYEEDVLDENKRDEIRDNVYRKLLRNRNLCEDFLSVNAVEYEDFSIGTSISLEEYADPDQVLAQIFFIIFRYFTPSVPFHTITEMQERGYTVDEIFEGPPLDHGFIDTAELEKTEFFRDIRLSDIISEVADIDGIKAITYFHLPFIDFDQPHSGTNYFYIWLRQLKYERKIARIRPDSSQVIFCKEREIITYNTGTPGDRRPERMLKLFRDLKTLERKYKLELTDDQLDFDVPAGENMELEDYYPVTYSLPMCYGVSERAGLPADADEKRIVQALQLKGYMLFFEQILSDYLVQLNHLRDLYTFDDSVEQTYFTRALAEIADFRSLVIDHAGHGPGNWDKILDDFSAVIQYLVETPGRFTERRNAFLNHMLARFGEDLSEYENITRWLTPYKAGERLIQDKIRILKDGEYYKISTRRGRGFDYSQGKTWNTSNVSGAERRLSRLLGFADANRKSLSPEEIIIEPVMDGDEHSHHGYHWKKKNIIKMADPEDRERILFTSREVKDGCCTSTLLDSIFRHADDRRNFVFNDGYKGMTRRHEEPSGLFSFELYDGSDPETAALLGKSQVFYSAGERDEAFKDLQKLMEKINSNEGLHLVEHLLLRPRIVEVNKGKHRKSEAILFDICLDACDLGTGMDEGTEVQLYRKQIHRIPPEKCFDDKPWILEYIRLKDDVSILFQETFPDDRPPVDLKFRKYDRLARRVRDLHEYGSERDNYEIVSNGKVIAGETRYSFIIHDEDKVTLAQSPFIYEENGTGSSGDIETEIASLLRFFGFEMDYYCQANPCDNNEDPYSFRTTAILPCWPRRFRDQTFRNLVEKTIEREFPAHVHTRIKWIGLEEMRRFEHVYRAWLEEMAGNMLPAPQVVNPLVHLLNTIEPCGCCKDEDCYDGDHEHGRHGRNERNRKSM